MRVRFSLPLVTDWFALAVTVIKLSSIRLYLHSHMGGRVKNNQMLRTRNVTSIDFVLTSLLDYEFLRLLNHEGSIAFKEAVDLNMVQ